ncbi:PIG-L deacetylase family protein [Pseudonocardia sp. HH130629-09]|uniref:PIG-L deacetylase family protein n=1 Tax=Pseudonocardia sp. HH130629-09 TaxID=1641402 RepID=UPI0039C902D3
MSIERALVIAAHPDDEVLGPGATTARLAGEGSSIAVLVLGSGVSERRVGGTVESSHRATERAAAALGTQRVLFGDFGAANILLYEHRRQDIVSAISAAVRDHCPELVFTHCSSDVHIDHQIVHQCTVYALRYMATKPVRCLLSYEVPSSTDQGLSGAFTPQVYVNVDETLSAKVAAMSEYTFELDGLGRSELGIRTLAAYRGMQVAIPSAEAFTVARQLWL